MNEAFLFTHGGAVLRRPLAGLSSITAQEP